MVVISLECCQSYASPCRCVIEALLLECALDIVLLALYHTLLNAYHFPYLSLLIVCCHSANLSLVTSPRSHRQPQRLRAAWQMQTVLPLSVLMNTWMVSVGFTSAMLLSHLLVHYSSAVSVYSLCHHLEEFLAAEIGKPEHFLRLHAELLAYLINRLAFVQQPFHYRLHRLK